MCCSVISSDKVPLFPFRLANALKKGFNAMIEKDLETRKPPHLWSDRRFLVSFKGLALFTLL